MRRKSQLQQFSIEFQSAGAGESERRLSAAYGLILAAAHRAKAVCHSQPPIASDVFPEPFESEDDQSDP
jgi:hypothetical protein